MNERDRLVDLLEAARETADAERARAEKAEAARGALQAKLDAAVAQGHEAALRVLAQEAVVEKAREWRMAIRVGNDPFLAGIALFAAVEALEVDRG